MDATNNTDSPAYLEIDSLQQQLPQRSNEQATGITEMDFPYLDKFGGIAQHFV